MKLPIATAVDVAMSDQYIPPTAEQEQQALAAYAVRELEALQQRKSLRIVVKKPGFVERHKMNTKNFFKKMAKPKTKVKRIPLAGSAFHK